MVGPWFELDEGQDEFTDGERAFAAAPGERFVSEPPPHIDGFLMREGPDGPLVAVLDVGDPRAPVSLLDFGVHFIGGRVRGDRVHNQLYDLPETSSSWALDATGEPAELGRLAAD